MVIGTSFALKPVHKRYGVINDPVMGDQQLQNTQQSDEYHFDQTTQRQDVDPLDLDSFLWGGLAGTIVSTAAGAVVLYYTLPWLLKTTKILRIGDNIVKQAKSILP